MTEYFTNIMIILMNTIFRRASLTCEDFSRTTRIYSWPCAVFRTNNAAERRCVGVAGGRRRRGGDGASVDGRRWRSTFR